MTPSEVRVPLPFKTCHNGLHMYDRNLKHCPECLEASRKRNYQKNKAIQIARETAKRLASPEAHEAYKLKCRKYHENHREELKRKARERYWANIEEARRNSREYARAHSEYGIWKMMIVRCTNKKWKQYADYGGRGIRVCPRWFGTTGFKNFLEDMGKRPSHLHSLERLDNNGNYEPDNVVWSTRKRQCRNRRNNFLITFRGNPLS